MRCPYCGGLNPDKVAHCINCGRNIAGKQVATTQQPVQNTQVTPGPQRTIYPPAAPYQPATRTSPAPRPAQAPVRPPQVQKQPDAYAGSPPATHTASTNAQPVAPSPARQAAPFIAASQTGRPDQVSQEERSTRRRSSTTPYTDQPIAQPKAPEAPVPFPPKNITQLKALEQGALNYTIIDDQTGYGKKKIVRIAYPRCAQWQQVGTLLKAYQEVNTAKFDTIIVQGVYAQNTDVYAYTNGQLVFDRNVRLGSQTLNRYQIETDNGFAADALRIVLTE